MYHQCPCQSTAQQSLILDLINEEKSYRTDGHENKSEVLPVKALNKWTECFALNKGTRFQAAPRNIHLSRYGKHNTDELRTTWPSPFYPSLPISDPSESAQAVQVLTLNALLLKGMSFSWETSLGVPLQGRLMGLQVRSMLFCFSSRVLHSLSKQTLLWSGT